MDPKPRDGLGAAQGGAAHGHGHHHDHGHHDHGHHDHGHDDHGHAHGAGQVHRAVRAGGIDRATVFASSAASRLALAGALSLLLWAAVWWALAR
jgi:hypothetical protein